MVNMELEKVNKIKGKANIEERDGKRFIKGR